VVNDIANSTDELSAINAARQLEIDLNRLYVLLRLGRIEGRKVDGEWRVSRLAVDARLRNRRQAATA